MSHCAPIRLIPNVDEICRNCGEVSSAAAVWRPGWMLKVDDRHPRCLDSLMAHSSFQFGVVVLQFTSTREKLVHRFTLMNEPILHIKCELGSGIKGADRGNGTLLQSRKG